MKAFLVTVLTVSRSIGSGRPRCSFMAALQSGSVDALRGVLASAVTARGDGGGKVPGAGARPVLGFDNVARL